MNVGVRGELLQEVVCVTAASSIVKEIFCWTVPVLMRISVLPEHTDRHHQVL